MQTYQVVLLDLLIPFVFSHSHTGQGVQRKWMFNFLCFYMKIKVLFHYFFF